MSARRTSFAPTQTWQRETSLVRIPPLARVGHALKIFYNSPAATDFLAVPPQTDSQQSVLYCVSTGRNEAVSAVY